MDGWRLCFAGHGFDLLGRRPVGQDGIEIEGGADRLRSFGAVARHHDHSRDACGSKRLKGARCLSTKLISQKKRTQEPVLPGDKDAKR